MCRLFGLTAGRERVRATFWLTEASDSLAAQSHRHPDGTGLGWFDEHGDVHIEKQELAAYEDARFASEARDRRSRTFIAHVRTSTGTAVSEANTHPFTMDGRIFAHNGSLGDMDRLEEHLGPDLARVHGDTDSERLFALITREIAAADGDVEAGIRTAIAWVAENLPVVSANFLLAEPGRLWALRHPDARELWFLQRRPEGKDLDHTTSTGTRITSSHLASTASVVVASERLDEEDGWTLLRPGELLSVGPELQVRRSPVLPDRGGEW